METRNITITLEKAREWYSSNNESLKEISLQAFNKDELTCNFKNITTFQKACEALCLNYGTMLSIINYIKPISKASAAMFELNIIRKALNLGRDLYLVKNPKDITIYYPVNPITTADSTYYKDELKTDKEEVIGKIKIDGVLYYVFNDAFYGGKNGLTDFNHDDKIGFTHACMGFLGCANEEIARHLGKYFGMLIIEAKYGDLPDFEIVLRIYQ